MVASTSPGNLFCGDSPSFSSFKLNLSSNSGFSYTGSSADALKDSKNIAAIANTEKTNICLMGYYQSEFSLLNFSSDKTGKK